MLLSFSSSLSLSLDDSSELDASDESEDFSFAEPSAGKDTGVVPSFSSSLPLPLDDSSELDTSDESESDVFFAKRLAGVV